MPSTNKQLAKHLLRANKLKKERETAPEKKVHNESDHIEIPAKTTKTTARTLKRKKLPNALTTPAPAKNSSRNTKPRPTASKAKATSKKTTSKKTTRKPTKTKSDK